MTGRRGMRTCGALLLAARLAASRFTAGRGKARRLRGVWLPISLRWRSTRRRIENNRAGRAGATAMARSVWLPQFHLHFDVPASDRTRHDESAGITALAAIREARRIVINRYWTSIRAATLTMQSPRAHRLPHLFHAGVVAVPKVHPSVAAVRRWPLSPMLSTIVRPSADRSRPHVIEPRPSADRSRPRLVEAIRNAVSPRTSSVERTQSFDTRAPIRPRELPAFRPRSSSVADAARRDPAASTPSPPKSVRPPELVYRRELRARTQTIDEQSHPSPTASSPGSSACSIAPETSADATPRAIRAPLRVTDLDPGLLDRLTDDVIRRVERRVRIERERRGL